MEYKDIKPLIESIPDFGWMSSERQREYMFNLGKTTTCAAEIGSYKGLSAAIVGLGMKDGYKVSDIDKHYYCIDTFKSSNVELDGKSTFSDFLENMRKFNLSYSQSSIGSWIQEIRKWICPDFQDKRVTLNIVDDFSYNVTKEVPNDLDWIYIDGSHETPDVLQDIELYQPKVKEGGLLLFHDHTWPTVRKAVDIAVRKNLIEVVEIFDDFGVYRKV